MVALTEHFLIANWSPPQLVSHLGVAPEGANHVSGPTSHPSDSALASNQAYNFISWQKNPQFSCFDIDNLSKNSMCLIINLISLEIFLISRSPYWQVISPHLSLNLLKYESEFSQVKWKFWLVWLFVLYQLWQELWVSIWFAYDQLEFLHAVKLICLVSFTWWKCLSFFSLSIFFRFLSFYQKIQSRELMP